MGHRKFASYKIDREQNGVANSLAKSIYNRI